MFKPSQPWEIPASRHAAETVAGELIELWRYPVKSMLGERCERLKIEPLRVAGDRLFAVRDVNGKFGSGKSTRRFRKIDGLLTFQARYRRDEELIAEIRFPSGEIVRGDDPSIDSALSAALGQPVVLAREAHVSHLDAGPIHLMTTASLAWLAEAMPEACVDPRRFRPNLVVAVPGAGPVEQGWLGRHLRIGREVELRISMPTVRCVMVTMAQGELAAEPGVLRHIAREASAHFGVYAEVTVPGTVRLHDSVSLVD